MASLTVRLNGEEVVNITLESGQEYIAGRAADAQIHLKIEKGISRHHIKFFERDGVWVCEALSKFGLLQRGSETLPVIELSEACAFAVPPYECVGDRHRVLLAFFFHAALQNARERNCR